MATTMGFAELGLACIVYGVQGQFVEWILDPRVRSVEAPRRVALESTAGTLPTEPNAKTSEEPGEWPRTSTSIN